MTGGVVALAGAVAHRAPAAPSSLHPEDAAAVLTAGVTESDPTADPSTPTPESPAPVGLTAAEPEVVDTAALAADALRVGDELTPRSSPDEDEDEDAGTEQPDADPETPATSDDAERPDEPAAATGDCGVDTSGLGRVKPHVREAAEFLGCRYDEPTMLGIAGRGGPSDHPNGLAVDFMVDRATGDALAACVLENKEALGVNYVIWRQRMNHGSGWKGMEDRGGATANHFDHVHVSFGKKGVGAGPTTC